MKRLAFAAACCLGANLAFAANVDEIEPNDTKPAATAATLACGDTLTGTSTGSSTTTAGVGSADYYRVKTAAAAAGIYRYRLTLTSTTAGHTTTIRGLTQAAGGVITPGTDTAVQTGVTTPTRFVQWYGFGAQEEIYYRVTGTTTTTAAYTSTLECQAVTPIAGPTVGTGPIRITTMNQGHTNDTDMWVYDSNFQAIAGYGNDDETTGTDTSRSNLVRNFTPGTYYLALSLFNLANNQPSNQADEDFKTGAVLDFPNAIADNSSSTNLNVSVAFIDGSSHPVPVTRAGAFDIMFIQFQVADLPGACCFSDGSCEEFDVPLDCTNGGGTYLGGGSVCSPNPCPQPAACCLPNGSCQFVLASGCTSQGGSPGAVGSDCDPNPCPPVPGACCFNDGSCTFVLAADCTTAGGAPQGGLVTCLVSTLYSSAPNLAIPDNAAAVTNTINVPDSFNIEHVSVAMQIRHTFIGDFDINLTHGATTVQLWSRDCSTNANMNIILDDGAGPLVCAEPTIGIANLAHTPGAALSAFNGLDAAGAWTISVDDQAAGDTGNLLYWAIALSDGTPQCAAVPAERACCFSNGACQFLLAADCTTAGGTPGADGSNCNDPDPCAAVCLHGDANCDGAVNNFDIDPFVAGILNLGSPTPPAEFGGTADCWAIRGCWGDINNDTAFNNFDIDSFVTCILASPLPGQPCP